MKIELFKAIEALGILNNKDSMTIQIQKTDEEFTVMVVINKDGKSCHPVVSGTADELDEGIMQEIIKPIEKIKGLKSNADSVAIEDNDEGTVTKKPDSISKTEEGKGKKASAKKVEAAKTTSTIEEKQPIEPVVSEPVVDAFDPKKRLAEINAELIEVGESRHIKIEELLKEASDLFPDDEKLLDAYDKKRKYINAMIMAEIMPAREEWTEGGTKWH
jgi:hypothetical protein